MLLAVSQHNASFFDPFDVSDLFKQYIYRYSTTNSTYRDVVDED